MDHTVQSAVFATEPSSFWYMLVFFCYLLLMRPHRRRWASRSASPAPRPAPNIETVDKLIAQLRSASFALAALSDEVAMMVLTTRVRVALDPQTNSGDPVIHRLIALAEEVHCEIFDAISLLDLKRGELQTSMRGGRLADGPAIHVCIRDRIVSVVRRSHKIVALVGVVNKLYPTSEPLGDAEKIRADLRNLSHLAIWETRN